MDEVDVAWGVVAAVVADAAQAFLLRAFGDRALTLPDELGGGGVDFFGDATAHIQKSTNAAYRNPSKMSACCIYLFEATYAPSALELEQVAIFKLFKDCDLRQLPRLVIEHITSATTKGGWSCFNNMASTQMLYASD